MTVYLDVLLLSNFWVDYALLRAAARFTNAPLRSGRMLLAGLLGAAGSLMIFLPPMPLLLCTGVRLSLALAMTALAFGIGSVRQWLRRTGVFLVTSLLFCGMIYAISLRKQPVGFYAQNTYVYADLSLGVLLLGTAAAAAVSTLIAYKSSRAPQGAFRLHLRVGGCDFDMPALADTGSSLRDAYSGLPVIVCTEDSLRAWRVRFSDAMTAAASCKGFRLLPVRTVAGQTVLPAFLPEYAAISRGGGREIPLGVMIALTDESAPETHAIVPACCVQHFV